MKRRGLGRLHRGSVARRTTNRAAHRAVIAALLVWSAAAPVDAQTGAVIEGRVIAQETGEPVAGITVSVEPGGPTVSSGADGRYRIAPVLAGSYVVVARGLGYADHSRRVNVTAGEAVVVDFALAARALALEALVVTHARREQQLEEVPAAIAVRHVDQLRSDGFASGTDEFRGVTGVSFRRGEGDGDEFPYVSIRGSTGVEGYLALIDGVPFVGLYEEALLSQVPYDAVERVEIFKGPVSALYGRGAIYGAANYLLRVPRTDATHVAVSAGGDDYYRAEATVERVFGDGAGLLLSGSYEDYGGWRENGGRRLANVFGRFRFGLGERTTLSLYANYSDRLSELANGIPLTADGEVLGVAGAPQAFLGYERPRIDQQSVLSAARVEHRSGSGVNIAVTGHARRIDRDAFWNFYDPLGFDPSRAVYGINGFRGATRHDVIFGEATARWQAGRHDLLAGVTAERGVVDENNRWSGQFGFTAECGFAFFLIEIDYESGEITNRDHPCFEVDVPRTRHRMVNTVRGAFIQDEITLGEPLFLTLGARYDSFRRTAEFEAIEGTSPGGELEGDAGAFSSRASLSWRYAGGQVYVSYGRGFNSNFGPSFEWDPAQYARPDNRPTTIDSYEAGWKAHALGGVLRWEAAVFYTRQKNRRITIPNPDAATDPTAAGNLITYGQLYDSRGAEVSVHIRPIDATNLTIGYSHIDPEWKDYVITTFGGEHIDLSGTTPVGVAPHVLHVAADQRIASWLTGRAAFEYYDDYAITQDNSVNGGAYNLLTLGARIQPRRLRTMSLDVSLTNALDKEYYFLFGGRTAPTYATPGLPRQLRAVLRATF